MAKAPRPKLKQAPEPWYEGPNIPLRVIRAFALAVAEKFHPEKIVLFGSHAYGQPNADSDVDLLVIMSTRNQLDQAFKIRLALPAPFPLDIIVRTPENLAWRLAEGESFHSEILSRGLVLYEKSNGGVGAKSGGGSSGRKNPGRRRRTSP